MFGSKDGTWFYRLVQFVLWIYIRMLGKQRIEGAENVPSTGGGVVVCNHTRGNDYFPLGVGSPRQIFFMVKGEAWSYNPVLTKIINGAGCFPVQRGAGDMEALQFAADIVKSGKLLGMFPEGTRSPDSVLQSGKTGAARVALQAGAVVIPAGVIGAAEAKRNFPRFWKRPVVTVRFGVPFVLEGVDGSDRRAVVAGTKRIMREIAALLPPEMRGEWGEGEQEASQGRKSREPRAAQQEEQADAALAPS